MSIMTKMMTRHTAFTEEKSHKLSEDSPSFCKATWYRVSEGLSTSFMTSEKSLKSSAKSDDGTNVGIEDSVDT